mgnify:CR=1 FL=1
MLSRSKMLVFVGLGLVFWLSGVLLIRLGGAGLFTAESPLLIGVYAAAFPLLYLSLLIASAISRVPLQKMLEPTVIMTFSAIFVDGAVIAWLPQLYGDTTVHVMHGAAWLLWGAAAGLLIAWVLTWRGNTVKAEHPESIE